MHTLACSKSHIETVTASALPDAILRCKMQAKYGCKLLVKAHNACDASLLMLSQSEAACLLLAINGPVIDLLAVHEHL